MSQTFLVWNICPHSPLKTPQCRYYIFHIYIYDMDQATRLFGCGISFHCFFRDAGCISLGPRRRTPQGSKEAASGAPRATGDTVIPVYLKVPQNMSTRYVYYSKGNVLFSRVWRVIWRLQVLYVETCNSCTVTVCCCVVQCYIVSCCVVFCSVNTYCMMLCVITVCHMAVP